LTLKVLHDERCACCFCSLESLVGLERFASLENLVGLEGLLSLKVLLTLKILPRQLNNFVHVMTVLRITVKRSVGTNKKINVLVHCSCDILYRIYCVSLLTLKHSKTNDFLYLFTVVETFLYTDILCVPTYLLAVIPPQREAETKAKVQEKRCTKRLAVGCMSVLQ